MFSQFSVILFCFFLSLVFREVEGSCFNVKWQFTSETISFYQESKWLRRYLRFADALPQRELAVMPFLVPCLSTTWCLHLWNQSEDLAIPHTPRAQSYVANYVLNTSSLQSWTFMLLHNHCLTFNHILHGFEQRHHGNFELGRFLPVLSTCISTNLHHFLLFQP